MGKHAPNVAKLEDTPSLRMFLRARLEAIHAMLSVGDVDHARKVRTPLGATAHHGRRALVRAE